MVWITFAVLILFIVFSVYINARLFVYIRNLEGKVQEQIDKNENMYQSLKELVQDDFLLADGRLRKFMYEKEKNRIYNGISVQDQEVNL